MLVEHPIETSVVYDYLTKQHTWEDDISLTPKAYEGGRGG